MTRLFLHSLYLYEYGILCVLLPLCSYFVLFNLNCIIFLCYCERRMFCCAFFRWFCAVFPSLNPNKYSALKAWRFLCSFWNCTKFCHLALCIRIVCVAVAFRLYFMVSIHYLLWFTTPILNYERSLDIHVCMTAHNFVCVSVIREKCWIAWPAKRRRKNGKHSHKSAQQNKCKAAAWFQHNYKIHRKKKQQTHTRSFKRANEYDDNTRKVNSQKSYKYKTRANDEKGIIYATPKNKVTLLRALKLNKSLKIVEKRQSA